jgi:hypothetical protein
MVSQQILPHVRRLTGLRDLRISNRVLDDLAYFCDGQADFSDLTLTQIDKVAVEHENAVQVTEKFNQVGHLTLYVIINQAEKGQTQMPYV